MQDVVYDLTNSRQVEHRYKPTEELLGFEHILEDVRLTLGPQILGSAAKITNGQTIQSAQNCLTNY